MPFFIQWDDERPGYARRYVQSGYAINASGQVTGDSYTTAQQAQDHAYLYARRLILLLLLTLVGWINLRQLSVIENV